MTVWEVYDLPVILFLNWCSEWLEIDKQNRKERFEEIKLICRASGAKFK